MRLATLNVGTLTARSRELASSLRSRHVDVCCIQETRWKGSKCVEIGDGYKLMYHGTTDRNGVGIVISEALRNHVTSIDCISDRLMAVKVDTGKTVMRIISAYAPQVGCTSEEKSSFYEDLEQYVHTIGDEEVLLLGGDLNGHVGEEREGFNRWHGGYGYGMRNEEGQRILEFAAVSDLIIANTQFRKRKSHLVTFASGGREAQIDFWMLRRRDRNILVDAKVIPSDHVAAQHHLLVMDLKISRPRKARPRTDTLRIKWWKLREQKDNVLPTLLSCLTPLDERTIEEQWNIITKTMKDSVVGILGKTSPGKTKIEKATWWWNEEVQSIIAQKKSMYKRWMHTHYAEDRDAYLAAKREAKKAVAIAKSKHYRELYDTLNTSEGEKLLYRLAKARHRSTTMTTGHIGTIKASNGNILRNPDDVLERWRQYFDQMFNEEFPHPSIPPTECIQGPVLPIAPAEVSEAIKKMKRNKATGPDDVPVDVWKLMGESGAAWLSKIFNRILMEGKTPEVWQMSTTVPIWKERGDSADCSSYRPIRLLCHTMKIFERILDSRLRAIVSTTPNQCGFVKGCGTTDAIHAARLLVERHREKNRSVHLAFLDLEKAFDRVPRDLIWMALRIHGIPEEYVRWIKMLYSRPTSVVRCAAGTSKPFPVQVGVHQGSALSPLLFILCVDAITRDIQKPHPWCLLYADDVMLAAETREELQEEVQLWKERLQRYGLRLNIAKTEYMECGAKIEDGTICVDGNNLKKVECFKYLGSRITSTGDVLPDAYGRANSAWMKWRTTTGILCDKKMPIRLKSKVYRTVVRPVALYGTECWAATKVTKQVLHTMEMRMLRWSMGLTLKDRVSNEMVRSAFGVAPIIDKMREARLRWFGHVLRREGGSVAKTALTLEVKGVRPRGRPKTRWLDCVKTDMAEVQLTTRDANNRNKWKKRCSTADPATTWDKR
ncbi:hypothetical protein Y032_0011g1280 [Ancylostoma ceylanicum]|nr:hypothetical protein Y032_0011g1280 [Ancylostoma ceylanicum]